jgi:cell division protein FtsN
VLKPEELDYAAQLAKTEGNAPARAIDSPRTAKAGAKAEEKRAAEKSAAKPAEKPAEPAAKDKKKAEDKKPAKAEQKPDPDTQRYDYAYQAATFPDAEQAKAFLKRVKGLNLKADIESGETNGKPWHRVVVFFQGTPMDTRALKEKLGGLGAQKLVMRSKTPL